jgi:hypothetical protein
VNPFTLDEHRALSHEMRQMARTLHSLCELVVGVYGPRSHAAFSFVRAVEDVERLNRDLNMQANQDGFPGTDLYL